MYCNKNNCMSLADFLLEEKYTLVTGSYCKSCSTDALATGSWTIIGQACSNPNAANPQCDGCRVPSTGLYVLNTATANVSHWLCDNCGPNWTAVGYVKSYTNPKNVGPYTVTKVTGYTLEENKLKETKEGWQRTQCECGNGSPRGQNHSHWCVLYEREF